MKRILIIEDDRNIAALERDYLEIEGFSVDVYYTGEDGLDASKQKPFDLFIVDVMLPGMDGFEVVRALRERHETPIFLVTAKDTDIDKVRGLGIGADDYVTKPFSPNELVARVKTHLKRYERLTKLSQGEGIKEEKAINIGDLVLNIATHSASYKGVDINFSVKEYQILQLLASHPERVFSKIEIYNRIWGEDFYGDTSTVAVHMKKIREKLAIPKNQKQLIETIWGVGYKLVP